MRALLFLCLSLAAPAAAQTPAVAMKDGFPITRADRLYKLSEVKKGDRGVGYTVFTGATAEPFDVEVLGVLKGMLGPGKDVILARLSGAKIEFTGVISGMSGSPVYVDGRLMGAVSYRFGAFTREPIAGITPIESMLALNSDQVGPKPLEPKPLALQRWSGALPVSKFRSAELPAPVLNLPLLPEGARPITTPLSVAGLDPETVAHLSQNLSGAGFMVAAGSAGGNTAALEPNQGSVAGTVPAAPIAPASPIAALIVKGDMDIAAIGTVSFVDGNRVLAFGHPFLGQGHASFPMATAAILNTLASEAGSYKQGAPAKYVGIIDQDRLTAIGGTLGQAAPMIPLDVFVRHADRPKTDGWRTQVQIADNPDFLPLMLDSVVASAGARRLGYEAGGTVSMLARIEVAGRTLEIDEVYSAPAPLRIAAYASRDLANTVGILVSSELGVVKVDKVSVQLVVSPDVTTSDIEALHPDQRVVRPGQSLGVTVVMRPYRGASEKVRIEVPIPADASGELELFVGGAVAIDRRDAQVDGEKVPTDLDSLLAILGERRPSRALYARSYYSRSGLRNAAETYRGLPPSQRAILGSAEVRTLAPLTESFGPLAQVPSPRVIQGSMSVQVRVVP